ncbi:MAG: GNAT family N-acetyltransferase [Microthrixaceae bacterium]
MRIRPAQAADGEALVHIERLAGARFRDVGMPEIADADPGSVDELAEYAHDGRSWVVVDDADRPLGSVLLDLVDGNALVEQLSVVPSAQGTGLGRALLDHVAAWAMGRGAPALTLTTFRDVPWNAPLYEHLGFHVLTEPELGPELRSLVIEEAAHGLDPTTRVCMIRPVHGAD